MSDLGRLTWVELPENRAAWQAVEELWDHVQQQPPLASRRNAGGPVFIPLFIHGPPGSGKSRLLDGLASRVSHAGLDLVIATMTARELRDPEPDVPPAWRDADIVFVEDIQHLAPRSIETMVMLVDRCLARRRPLLVTATEGPAQLTSLPVRLTSRLAQGLVVGVHPLTPTSRATYLRQRATTLGLSVSTAVVNWLAANTPGSVRQLEGTLTRIERLTAVLGHRVDLADLESAFDDEAERRHLSIDQIAHRVGEYYRVDPRALRSQSRGREVLLPRQIGMYLARQLTTLSLVQIGDYFGGRDHSTVLHACRKVADALPNDSQLSGAVQRLQTDLG